MGCIRKLSVGLHVSGGMVNCNVSFFELLFVDFLTIFLCLSHAQDLGIYWYFFVCDLTVSRVCIYSCMMSQCCISLVSYDRKVSNFVYKKFFEKNVKGYFFSCVKDLCVDVPYIYIHILFKVLRVFYYRYLYIYVTVLFVKSNIRLHYVQN